MIKVTDFIVEFLISKGITDVFGYPGGVICHFIDSLSKYDFIQGHINYHEQASAFAACGYAQECGKPGIAYSTSGPGATNLVTGIANAYYDSIPTMFLTGQVDTYGLKRGQNIRQQGFQETDVIGIVTPITKYAVRIDDPKKIRYELEKAYDMAISGNPGPVLLDLPADVQRAMVDEMSFAGYRSAPCNRGNAGECVETMAGLLQESKQPCFLLGNGVKQCGEKETIREIIEVLDIPVVTSMPAVDMLSHSHRNNFGFIGANGHRYGNFVLGKSDLIIAIGSRMDMKQVGGSRNQFADQATLFRIDIDTGNLEYKVHDDEIGFAADIRDVIPLLKRSIQKRKFRYSKWSDQCQLIKGRLQGYDDEPYTFLIKSFSAVLPDNICVTADVGQSEVWIAQQFQFKNKQSFHIFGGHGAMGYSLPAAIGVYYASRKPVVSFHGDGGIQMNIQELQFLVRENIPITVVIINNHSLGMIRGFQEANFNRNYQQTTKESGYLSPDYEKIAKAYGLEYIKIEKIADIETFSFDREKPRIVEIVIPDKTTLRPNFGQNGKIQDQRPYLDRKLYEEVMRI